jgi:uncharacterized protein
MKHLVWLLAGLLLASTTTLAQAVAPRMLLVRGAATRELTPETAELMLTYRVADNVRDADRAREQQTRLLAVLRDHNIAPEKLVVYNVSASGYGFSKTVNSSVSLTKQYKLVLDKPALLDELLPKLVQTGADEVVVINLLSSRLDAFRLEVMSLALADARIKAQHIAQQTGLKLTGTRAVLEVVPTRSARPSREELLKMRGAQALEETIGDNAVGLRSIRVSSAFDVEYDVQ